METLEKSGVDSPLAQYLHDAFGKAEAGDYTEALSLLKPAKSLEPRNVYILAFEKQLEQLIEYKQRNILSDDQRTDIMDSLPGIIDRAIAGGKSEAGEGAPAGEQPAAGPGVGAGDRAAAFEWLKNQYFQHAHEHVRRGEFQNALGEIRRVYIIDPGNKVAHDFERQIQLKVKLQEERSKAQESAGAPAPSSEAPKAAAVPAASPKEAPKAAAAPAAPLKDTAKASAPPPAPPKEKPAEIREPEVMPVKTEEWSSPPAPYPISLRGPMASPEPEKDSSRMIVIFLLLVVLFAVGAGLFFWGRQNDIRKSVKEPVGGIPAPAETYYAARDQAAEQSYVVSATKTEPGSRSPQVSAVTPATAAGRNGQESTPSAGDRTGATEQAAPQKAPVTTVAAKPVPVERSPEVVKLEKPRFPESAYAKGLSGQVIVEVQINVEGKPLRTRILKSTNPLLEDPVVEAVMHSKYLPGQMASGPVTSWLTIPFRFEENR